MGGLQADVCSADSDFLLAAGSQQQEEEVKIMNNGLWIPADSQNKQTWAFNCLCIKVELLLPLLLLP